jgi:hypothetical protein
MRLAAVGPVADVVRIDVAVIQAARKATTLVAVRQRAAYRRRNAARTAADVQRLAVPPSSQCDHRGVAYESSRRLGGNRAAVLDMTAVPVLPSLRQHRAVHVHHDLVALGLA